MHDDQPTTQPPTRQRTPWRSRRIMIAALVVAVGGVVYLETGQKLSKQEIADHMWRAVWIATTAAENGASTTGPNAINGRLTEIVELRATVDDEYWWVFRTPHVQPTPFLIRTLLAAVIVCWPVLCSCTVPFGNATEYQPPALSVGPEGDSNRRMSQLEETAPVAELRPGQTVSLEDCVRMALTTNRRIRRADRRVDLSRADERSASAGYWPTLNAEAGYQATIHNRNGSPFDYLQGSVTLGVPIYTFGKLEAGLEAAEAGTRAAGFNAERVRQLLVLQDSFAYYNVLEARGGPNRSSSCRSRQSKTNCERHAPGRKRASANAPTCCSSSCSVRRPVAPS